MLYAVRRGWRLGAGADGERATRGRREIAEMGPKFNADVLNATADLYFIRMTR
jgi:hypothetical protein